MEPTHWWSSTIRFGARVKESRITDRKGRKLRYSLLTSAFGMVVLLVVAGKAFAAIRMCSGECSGTGMDDKLIGGTQDDRILAGGGNDKARGGEGDDFIKGGWATTRFTGRRETTGSKVMTARTRSSEVQGTTWCAGAHTASRTTERGMSSTAVRAQTWSTSLLTSTR